MQAWPFAFPQPGAVPGALAGPEPWISRGLSSRAPLAASSRLGGPAAAIASGCGTSSNASSSGADDDLPVKDEDGMGHDDMACRRGLSGGHLVELQQSCQQDYAQQYHPFLQRYVDVMGSGA